MFGVRAWKKASRCANRTAFADPVLAACIPLKISCLQYKLTPTSPASSAQALDQLARARNRVQPVHLKIDTGFGRIGVQAGQQRRVFLASGSRLAALSRRLYTHLQFDVDLKYTRRSTLFFKRWFSGRRSGFSRSDP